MGESKRKYGLITAISLVVGSVIGSGVFFKAESISRLTGGNIKEGLLAWCIGGGVMLMCLLTFARVSEMYPDGGIILYAKETVGEGYACFLGWFMATMYYPSLISVLSWLSARYTLLFLGASDENGGLCMLISCLFLIMSFAQNTFLPAFSGKIQIITTVIKIIPLVLMIFLGTANGINTGILLENMLYPQTGGSLFGAITATAFAYEGWITAISVGGEMENRKKTLSLALISGGIIITAIYVLYYVGICGAVNIKVLTESSSQGIRTAFDSILGKRIGGLLTLFVAISCIGALNGLVMGSIRAMHSLSGLRSAALPKAFSKTEPDTGICYASSFSGLVFSSLWLLFYYGARLSDTPLFMGFGFDSSELCVISAYLMYIPIFLMTAIKHREKSAVLPLFGMAACVFIIICAVFAHKNDLIDYFLTFTSVMLFGMLFYKKI